MKIAVVGADGQLGSDLATAFTANGDVDGNHMRLDTEHAANSGIAIVSESADGIAGVDDLECVERRGEGVNNLSGGHRQGDRAGLKNGMTSCKKLFGVDVGDRAGGRNFKIATDKLGADSRPGNDAGNGGGGDGAKGAIGVRL